MNRVYALLGNTWQRLSERERYLALAVGGLVALFVVFGIVRGIVRHLDELGSQIVRLEDNLVNYHYQIARRESVERLYAEVASQHSSEWTIAEIHDRLRQEIYRLAQKVPPGLDEQGIPIQATNDQGSLVEIPSLGTGQLNTEELGYREYALQFRLPATDLENIVAFLERLQSSPQSLRIDRLELVRPANRKAWGSAAIDITRTVVDDVSLSEDGGDSVLRGGDLEQAHVALDIDEWTGVNCEIQQPPYEGAALVADANEGLEIAKLFREHPLESQATYELFLTAQAEGPCMLNITDVVGGNPFSEGIRMESGPERRRYHLRFTVPGNEGGEMRLRLPMLELKTPDSRIVIEDIRLRKVSG